MRKKEDFQKLFDNCVFVGNPSIVVSTAFINKICVEMEKQEATIEAMKCCGNCKYSFNNSDYVLVCGNTSSRLCNMNCLKGKCDKWVMVE